MSYLGAKSGSGVYQAIISQMPPHDVYIETHLGSGAIMRRKAPAARNIGIDLDEDVIQAYEAPYPIELYHGDATKLLRGFDTTQCGEVLIYADPPYLLRTRTSRARYNHDYTDDDHTALLEVLLAIDAHVIISGYPSELYDDMLQGWGTMEFQAMTRGGVRTEKIWMNFAKQKPFWSDYAGKDFTDRQRIKRKADRWAANYAALPEPEKLAIMNALLRQT